MVLRCAIGLEGFRSSSQRINPVKPMRANRVRVNVNLRIHAFQHGFIVALEMNKRVEREPSGLRCLFGAKYDLI